MTTEPLTIAEVAVVEYTLDVIRLDELARDYESVAVQQEMARQPLMSRLTRAKAADVRKAAAIAYRAGRAETRNVTPPGVVPCRICGGVRACEVDG